MNLTQIKTSSHNHFVFRHQNRLRFRISFGQMFIRERPPYQLFQKISPVSPTGGSPHHRSPLLFVGNFTNVLRLCWWVHYCPDGGSRRGNVRVGSFRVAVSQVETRFKFCQHDESLFSLRVSLQNTRTWVLLYVRAVSFPLIVDVLQFSFFFRLDAK